MTIGDGAVTIGGAIGGGGVKIGTPSSATRGFGETAGGGSLGEEG